MDSYTPSHPSTYASTPSENSPLASSPLSTPETSDLEDAPPLNFAGGLGLGAHSTTHDPTFVLVIGGLGFIGSHTVLELLRAGFNVIVVDNLSNSYESVLHNIKLLAGKECKEKGIQMPLLHFHRCDYRSRSMRFLLESYTDLVPTDETERRQMTYQSRITGVIHFAAYKSVSESIGKPLAYYNNNVCGLVSLLELLDKFAIRNFIFSSSATVYGSKANAGVPLREEDLVHFPETVRDPATDAHVDLTPSVAGLTCPYGRTKYMAEAILADLAEADDRWRIVALRYFNPVGCDPSGLLGESPRNAPTNLYPVITQVLTGDRSKLDVFGSDWDTRDGSAVRDFVHVLDVARGHIAALRPSPTGFRAYNLGSGNGTTVLEAVRSLEHAAGREIPLDHQGRRAGDVGTCVASNARARAELGWAPRESITQCAVDLWNFVSRTVGVSKTPVVVS
ncbi:UDP-glucose 4-epimerase [Cryphonectria parasitica EP155]|uniref:UDP-glucose 4-epimerase n=1 Tax=Cryphonectria parasitica (strain ATCC 38755 / EP155) TaxID=660469 RepID=A0A9P5CLJ1_CRYP1|nr:UDP-glucose 4-epimerase [Cryphonectria parasitica EP155]KAF3761885.1 UDP-glucose 4-epimerase [Cryphonectria parasitica EP155]